MTRLAAIAAFLAALLAVDTLVDARTQLLLGAATWMALLVACRGITAERRAQVAIVIAAATLAEVTGSIVWGVYTYRLENLPSFVPPAHGLVYLAGVALSGCVARYARYLVALAVVGALGWAAAGLTVLPRTDVGGALGALLLSYYLVRGRAPAMYAGVFLAVAALELYGTAIGTWTWAATIPGTGIPNGNPPSGVASGYVWFDVMALALAPRVLAGLRALSAPGRKYGLGRPRESRAGLGRRRPYRARYGRDRGQRHATACSRSARTYLRPGALRPAAWAARTRSAPAVPRPAPARSA